MFFRWFRASCMGFFGTVLWGAVMFLFPTGQLSYASSLDNIDFIVPVQCELGVDCLIVNYVDQEEGIKHLDYECNSKTYNGHKGVDFAVPNYRDMIEGVNVIAARGGKVFRVRDGEDDLHKDDDGYDAIKDAGRECGNGILIQHEKGWRSFYCHLKKDSILVKPDEDVVEGQTIAQIGQSGWSEFPHLHFSLIKNSIYVDPFTGLKEQTGCGVLQKSLWRSDIEYTPFAVFDGGFSTEKLDFKALYRGEIDKLEEIDVFAPALIYWAGLYHSQVGDEVVMTIKDPIGRLYHERRFTIDRSKKRAHFFYAGRKKRTEQLISGQYTGSLHIMRRNNDGSIKYQKTYKHMIHVK